MTTLTPATDLDSLSTRLREATRPEHEHAETRGFVTDLMSGALGRDAYVDLATQHHAIYSALEDVESAMAGDAVGATFVFGELARVASLEADLAVLRGPDWRTDVRLLPSTQEYGARIRSAGSAWSGHYLAHAYTRYLGDLSGGQIVRRMLERHYGLADDELTFYAFPSIAKPKVFKDGYRARIDAAPYSPAEGAEIVAEVRRAFAFNSALFTQLGEVHHAAARPA
ncbi:Heme oxygenase [Beutenbergia cavernae DSM 12333]|uniref:Heme oxygenase n=1 Tax=Beutenbergia cavernae (strain ATCC BAA-8 / DSM 12333 / CCUG 43141 / JCM 11478 / NBRC 16432 / NCIMB 13614 / HKI 0122) TaxID=471853 RepID=C5C4J0_BEUC1|nr:biliverdin-producing heme oxygenase [Beutenbergia cavernae]ACQ82114.1 Heme oxygenase [Beutenbergia cavernae DSM 12333]